MTTTTRLFWLTYDDELFTLRLDPTQFVTEMVAAAKVALARPEPVTRIAIHETREGPPLEKTLLVPEANTRDAAYVVKILPAAAGPVQATKRFRSNWQDNEAPRVLEYKRENPTFKIETSYSLYSGLVQRPLLLRNLPRFQEQFEFLLSILHDRRKDESGNPYATGWIVGPPGVGKSTTAFAFALTIERPKWLVTWIHLTELHPFCVQFNGSKKRSRQVLHEEFDVHFSDLMGEDSGQYHLLFLDGFKSNGHKHKDISAACHLWLGNDLEHRRLVIITSMSSRGKANDTDDYWNNVKVYNAQSWTLGELVEAAKDKEFFDMIKDNLDSSNTKGLASKDLIESKFYFAGGSSRYMFDYPTNQVILSVREAIAAVDDIMPYIRCTAGDRSNSVINRLFSYNENAQGERSTGLISQYAATMLAAKEGPDLVKQLSKVVEPDSNPSLHGWLFEMWFFASLRHSGITVAENGINMNWAKSRIDELDPTDIKEAPKLATWYKPKKWNQGGYDAVYIDPVSQLVRIVQVTAGKKHEFKVDFFYLLLKELAGKMETKTLEIYFLFETGEDLQISLVIGEGLLLPFGDCWRPGNERQAVKKATVDWT